MKPTISNLSPSTGAAGSSSLLVTINGSGFGSSPTVSVTGGIGASVTQASNTQIVVSLSIPGSTSGNQSLTVTAQGQTSASVSFDSQMPNSFHLLALTGPRSLGCELGFSGFGVVATYELWDQSGAVINQAGLTPQEHFTVNGTQSFPGYR